jgi:hypothetical protein
MNLRVGETRAQESVSYHNRRYFIQVSNRYHRYKNKV